MHKPVSSFVTLMLLATSAVSAEPLVLDLDLDADLVSLSHNIDNFLFPPSRNLGPAGDTVINDLSAHAALQGRLVATCLVRRNGEVVGIATEQEFFLADETSQRPLANSMWLIHTNAPGLRGFLVVNQIEDGHEVFSMVERVLQNPQGPWDDEMRMYLSTRGETRVGKAYGDLAAYEGGRFEEYNGLNPSDYGRLNRFRGTIRFVVYPAEAD